MSNEMDRETAERHARIIWYTCPTSGAIADYLQKHFGKPNELVELDEEAIVISFESFLEPHTCGWKIKQFYIDNGHYFRSWISEICAKFGQRQTEDVGELLEMIRVLLEYYKSKINSPRVIYFKGEDIVDYAEQAIAKFKERKG